MRTYGRTSYSPPVPHQRPKKGGRSLHDHPSGASPAGRVNGPQGRTFLPVGVGGVRRIPLPVRILASWGEGRPQEAGGAASGRKALCPGATFGQTDEFALRSAGEELPVRDVHATLLRLMGLDQDQLTFLHAGRFKRLTDIGGRVIEEILL